MEQSQYQFQSKYSNAYIFNLLKNTKLNLKNTKPYIPDIHFGRVIKVYGGDTISIATQLYNGDLIPTKEMYNFKVILNNIDTPDIKSSNDDERVLAIVARDALSTLVMDNIVRLEDISYDNYGRLLCNVFLEEEDIDVCKWMVEHNYAVGRECVVESP
jgi:endonuclease YncB( thermonuclease family)